MTNTVTEESWNAVPSTMIALRVAQFGGPKRFTPNKSPCRSPRRARCW
jgi:hypothetical protein